MNTVAIIGGGITGLAAAYRLQTLGVPVTLYESSRRLGGVIRTTCRGGYLAEFGPNTILETSPLITQLITDLGLEQERLYSDPAASNRYVVRDGRLIPVPGSPLEFLTTPLFSTLAKLRLPFETVTPRAPRHLEENVEQFVLRRLGREFLDYAINPMIGGIYAGDPAKLSVTHAFPKLHDVEQRYGSLLLGQFLGARERRNRREVSKQTAPKFSFTLGLQSLIDTLQEKIGDAIQLATPITRLCRRAEGWLVTTLEGDVHSHSAVLLAAPAHKLAEIELKNQADSHFASLAPLGEITYAPVATLVLGFKRSEVRHPLDGFGVLIPQVEKRDLLGVLFSSSLFPNRAPRDHVTLTCYIGGMRSPHLATLQTQPVVELARKDLKNLLGVTGQPTFIEHAIFPKAIPQYEVGFGRFKDYMTALENKLPGLFLAGHFRNGISLSDSILAGLSTAEKITSFCGLQEETGTVYHKLDFASSHA